MEWLHEERSQKVERLLSILIVLGTLLSALAIIALFSDLLALLGRFHSELFLFLFGALLAYLIAPLVHLLQRVVRVRWAAVLGAYLLLFLTLVAVGFLLINPFISQARSLVQNLQNPPPSSLHQFDSVSTASIRVQTDITSGAGTSVLESDIAALQTTITALSATKPRTGKVRVPPSYVAPLNTAVARLASDVRQSYPSRSELSRDTSAVVSANGTARAKTASTPLLLLGLQQWLDDHGIRIDLKDKFGKTLQQVSSQVASLVNNALGIALKAGNLMLNTVLVLIISIYFLADGQRLVNWMISLVPRADRAETRYLVQRLDAILGTYMRTQVLMAMLVGTLDAIGAVVVGVPYAVVVFFSSFLLSLVPVIGPVVLPLPPMVIALVFAPLPRPVIYLCWLLIGEQLATNVIGPRVQGHSVGIHPLEAMAAALIGFPLAGFIGAFFAVPLVAFLHVAVTQILLFRRERTAREVIPAGVVEP